MSDGKDKTQAWKAAAQRELRGRPLDDLTWHTPEGIDVKPLYTEADLSGVEWVSIDPPREGFCASTSTGLAA